MADTAKGEQPDNHLLEFESMLRTILAGGATGDPQDLWYDRVVDAHPLEGGAGDSVATSTEWARVEEPLDADNVICDCLQIRLDTLQACIKGGCATQDDLARETGVTTICGGCAPRVAQLVGGASGYVTRISEVREILPTVRSFRFASADPGHVPPWAYPGQHVVVSAFIEGEWISRPYTLTSPAGLRRYQEFTVKLEPGGVLSNWLFERRPGDFHSIRVTPPRGNFLIDLARSEPIVFFAAGIGITPAMAIVRTLAAQGSGCPVHIDYSARDSNGFAFRDELDRLAASNDPISTSYRATRGGDRLNAEEVSKYQWRFPHARFCICGPESYQKAVGGYLSAAGVEKSRVQVEVFTQTKRSAPGSPAAVRRPPGPAPRTLGVVLLCLYLAQGVLSVEWPWLEALQTVESYRRWSGVALFGYIAHQWLLPVSRIRERFSAATAATAYRWHRWVGAFAPLFFYAHATWLGFGYLLLLAVVYLANVVIGLGDKTIITDLELRHRYARIWLVPHVALACLTVGLTIFHIFVVFAYR